MIPTISSPDLPRVMARLDDLAKLAPERRKKALGVAIREVERNAKRIARSGGVFSRRSTGTLARSLRGSVVSTTLAVLNVGVQYGLIQDHGGVTRPHPIKLRFAKAFAFPSSFGSANAVRSVGKSGRMGKFQRRGASVRGTAAGYWVGSGSKGTPGVINHPGSRIPATNYSWKAYLASREEIRKQIADAMLGRGVYA